jgi:hypothetical protein
MSDWEVSSVLNASDLVYSAMSTCDEILKLFRSARIVRLASEHVQAVWLLK